VCLSDILCLYDILVFLRTQGILVSLGHKECVCLYDTLNTRNPCVKTQGILVSEHKESLCQYDTRNPRVSRTQGMRVSS